MIAAADSGTVTALSANDGAVAWSMDAGGAIRATPLVAGRFLFVPTDAALLKLDLASGRRLWASSLGKPKSPRLEVTDPKSRWDHYSSSAVLAGDSVYAGSRDGCVYRFNADSGETVGRYCSTDLITATPVIDGNRVYFASFDRQVYAADRDTGRIVWKRDVQGEVPRDLTLAGRNILAGSRSYDLVALDKATGKPAWTRYYWFSWVDSIANVVGRTIYIGSSDSLRVYALDVTSGKKLWVSQLPGWAWARPAVGRKTVYESIAGSSGYNFGGRTGGFAAIDRATGKLRWMIELKEARKSACLRFRCLARACRRPGVRRRPRWPSGRLQGRLSGERLELGERAEVRLVGRDRRDELAGAVEQQDRGGMLHLLAHRRVGHRLGEDAILFLDLVDLRLGSGQADDRRAEQLGILADLLGPIVRRGRSSRRRCSAPGRWRRHGAAGPAATGSSGRRRRTG